MGCIKKARVLLAFALMVGGASRSSPLAIWTGQPARPGETVMVQGLGWAGAQGLQIDILKSSSLKGGDLLLLPSNDRSLRFRLPAKWPMGIYRCTVKHPKGDASFLLNAPEVWWWQADGGRTATAGGWVRIFGRCLHYANASAELRQEGKRIPLNVPAGDEWSLLGSLPQSLPAGRYTLHIENGLEGPEAGVDIELEVKVSPKVANGIRVVDFGAIPDDAGDDSDALRRALAALGQQGGGVLELPRGRLRLKGGFYVPPHVEIRGMGENASYLAWDDTDSPPEALIQAGDGFALRDLGIYAFAIRRGVVVGTSAKPAHGVRVSHVRMRLTPFSILNLSKAENERRRAALEHSVAMGISTDDAQVTDCDFAIASRQILSMAGRDQVVARNSFFAESEGWCSFASGERSIVEDNTFAGCTAVIARGTDVYFARNRSAHNYRGFREALTTDGCGGGPGDLKVLSVDGASMHVGPAASRTDPLSIPAVVRILDGAGAGQWRRVVGYKDSTLTMDRPWDVPPDSTSALTMGNAMRHHLVIGNEASDSGIAAQLYAGALECVVAGNRSTRSGGFRVWGRQAGPGSAPGWYVQLEGNVIDESYGTEGPEAGGGTSAIEVIGDWGSPTYKGPTIRGIVIRGNELSPHATINIRRRVRDVLVEDNPFADGQGKVTREMNDQQEGVVIRP